MPRNMQQLLRPTPHPVFDANGTTKYVLVSHRTTVGLPETHIMFNGSSKGGPCMAGGDQLRLPWTVRGDQFWRGTIDGVTGLHAEISVVALACYCWLRHMSHELLSLLPNTRNSEVKKEQSIWKGRRWHERLPFANVLGQIGVEFGQVVTTFLVHS